MDVPWVQQKFEEFLQLLDDHEHLAMGTSEPDYSALSKLHRREATVKMALRALSPALAKFNLDEMGGDLEAKANVERGLGMLADRHEWDIRLAPDAPTLPADKLHPWVWDSARTLWETRHYRQAVQTAWTTINAKIQDKVQRRDVSDTKLVQDTFSEQAPVPGKPRLRVQGDPTTETVQSRQRGALQLGLACVSLIRNPASHEDTEFDEQIALEQLATLSVFARVVDECKVITS
jgi:hypothetical protein